MPINNFEFIIGSPTDREKLICEIYYKEKIIAELSQETTDLILEIYPLKENQYWIVPLDEFQNALEFAKNHLLSTK